MSEDMRMLIVPQEAISAASRLVATEDVDVLAELSRPVVAAELTRIAEIWASHARALPYVERSAWMEAIADLRARAIVLGSVPAPSSSGSES